MRTTSTWAMKRQAIYGLFFLTIVVLFIVYIYIKFFYSTPTCFDNIQGPDEAGVDCGGACTRICPFEVLQPSVEWARSFRVTTGVYNAVAYVENLNRKAATAELRYTFSLYDDAGLIVERSGTTILPPNSVYPIFEGRIETGGRIPTKTFLELEEPDLWQPAESGSEQFVMVDRELVDADDKPRLNAVVRNDGLTEARQVEVIATIFDTNRTALASSRTFIDNFGPRSDEQVVFTWPEPIAKTIKSCEIPTDVVLAIDLSGSMNNDGDNPPEPLTSVKNAASAFIGRLGSDDMVGVVTFATEATTTINLSADKAKAALIVSELVIDPEEESGSTNTGMAIGLAGFEVTSERHNPDARKVVVLLTDGLATAPDENPEEYALDVATQVNRFGIELYTIGLGEQVNMDFVRQIATEPSYAYQALTTEDLDRIYQTITSALCEEGAAVIDIIAKSDTGFVPLR